MNFFFAIFSNSTDINLGLFLQQTYKCTNKSDMQCKENDIECKLYGYKNDLQCNFSHIWCATAPSFLGMQYTYTV